MNFFEIFILAIVQGATELLPVSSSAHVIVAEKLMGLDPTRPEMTLLLVALHTGTMFGVIVFFWRSWRESFFKSRAVFWRSATAILSATLCTGMVGLLLKALVERLILRNTPHAEIEILFGNLLVISAALAAVGILIIFAGWKERADSGGKDSLGLRESGWIGAVQGVCLPFRGFSRSGATISAGLLLGVTKKRAEEFSFALAVVLTPPVIAREVWRLLKTHPSSGVEFSSTASLFYPSLMGMVLSFISGILALKWLSNWLDRGRWYLFGIYCLFASVMVFLLYALVF